jgi:hypothetical protein
MSPTLVACTATADFFGWLSDLSNFVPEPGSDNEKISFSMRRRETDISDFLLTLVIKTTKFSSGLTATACSLSFCVVGCLFASPRRLRNQSLPFSSQRMQKGDVGKGIRSVIGAVESRRSR